MFYTVAVYYCHFSFRLCSKNRKCSKLDHHPGRCNSKREYHPYWTGTKKLKIRERNEIQMHVDVLKEKAASLEGQNRDAG